MIWKVVAGVVATVAGAMAVYLTVRMSPAPDLPPMRLNHVGISVANMDDAIDFYTKDGLSSGLRDPRRQAEARERQGRAAAAGNGILPR